MACREGVYYIQYPDRFRMEILNVFTMVVSGDKGWMEQGGDATPMEKEQLANAIQDQRARWISSLLPLKDKAFKLSKIESVEVDKKPALGVKVTRKDYPE